MLSLFFSKKEVGNKTKAENNTRKSAKSISRSNKKLIQIVKDDGSYTDSSPQNLDSIQRKTRPLLSSLLEHDEKTPAENVLHHAAKLPGAGQLITWLLSSGLSGDGFSILEGFLLQTNTENKTPIEIAIENGRYENFQALLTKQLAIKDFKKDNHFSVLLFRAMVRIPTSVWNDNNDNCLKIYEAICKQVSGIKLDLFPMEYRVDNLDWHFDSPFVRYLLADSYSKHAAELRSVFLRPDGLLRHDLKKAYVCLENLKLLLEIYSAEKVEFTISPKYCSAFMVKYLLQHHKDKAKRECCETILNTLLLKLNGSLTLLNKFVMDPSREIDLKGMDNFVVHYKDKKNVDFQKYLKTFFVNHYNTIHSKRLSIDKKPMVKSPIHHVQGDSGHRYESKKDNGTFVQTGPATDPYKEQYKPAAHHARPQYVR